MCLLTVSIKQTSEGVKGDGNYYIFILCSLCSLLNLGEGHLLSSGYVCRRIATIPKPNGGWELKDYDYFAADTLRCLSRQI